MAKPGKYQRPNEIKFRDQKPDEGQLIAVRFAGEKTYYRAKFLPPDHVALFGHDGELSGCVRQVHGATSQAGWCAE